MKRFFAGLCMAVSLVVLSVPVRAQEVSLGVKGGLNAAKFGGSDVNDLKSYTRMIGGAFMVVDFGKFLVFQPELLYSQKGSKIVENDVSAKIKVDYVEVPLLARLQLPSAGSSFLPYGVLGPTVAFNTSCSLGGEMDNAVIEFNCDDPEFGLAVRSVDLGVAFGAGAEAAVGRAFLGLDARYVLGLSKIDESDRAHDVKNRAFGVMLGLRIPLGGPAQVASRTY